MPQSLHNFIGLAALSVAVSAAGPCCKACTPPLVKYFSVDVAHGFCGNTCLDPKRYSTFKKFEANLTLVDEEHPVCSGQYTPVGTFYTDYDSTVTHGDPFGILSVTLDLYAPTGMPDHSCCSTLLPFCTSATGKPKRMTIQGTGPYCCPASATEEKPCPKGTPEDGQAMLPTNVTDIVDTAGLRQASTGAVKSSGGEIYAVYYGACYFSTKSTKDQMCLQGAGCWTQQDKIQWGEGKCPPSAETQINWDTSAHRACGKHCSSKVNALEPSGAVVV